MAEPDKNKEAVRYLTSIGWSEAEAQKWLRGPARGRLASPPAGGDPYEPPPRLKVTGKAYELPDDIGTGHPMPPSRPQHGPGVRFRDIEYWCLALRHTDLQDELRALYVRHLKAALLAAETPGVTPEDIAYWLHALADPTLPAELRALYKRSVREALRKYHLDAEEAPHGDA